MNKKYNNGNEVVYGYFRHNGKKYRYDKEGMRCVIAVIVLLVIVISMFTLWQFMKPEIPDTPVGYERVYKTEFVTGVEDVVNIAEESISESDIMGDTYDIKSLLLDIEVTNHKSVKNMSYEYISVPYLIKAEY